MLPAQRTPLLLLRETKHEVSRNGSMTVFHRRGGMAWTHPKGRAPYVDQTTGRSYACECGSKKTTMALVAEGMDQVEAKRLHHKERMRRKRAVTKAQVTDVLGQ